jgi:hypothetical protein
MLTNDKSTEIIENNNVQYSCGAKIFVNGKCVMCGDGGWFFKSDYFLQINDIVNRM